MPTVSHVVSNLVNQQPFLREAMLQDIISYAKLAYWMKPQVERQLGKKVRDGAITMALHRISESARAEESKTKTVFSKGQITLSIKSDIMEFTFLKSRSVMDSISLFYDRVNFEQGEVFNVTQGNYEVSVVVSRKLKKEFEEHMRSEKALSSLESLALLSIKFPPEVVGAPGFFSQVTSQLAWHDINILESFSTYTEMMLALEENSVTRAYNVLQDLFRRKISELKAEQ
ncbi:MAG: hypothetical protein WC488_03520 [Candidatus Micrarchaeia archaeon]